MEVVPAPKRRKVSRTKTQKCTNRLLWLQSMDKDAFDILMNEYVRPREIYNLVMRRIPRPRRFMNMLWTDVLSYEDTPLYNEMKDVLRCTRNCVAVRDCCRHVLGCQQGQRARGLVEVTRMMCTQLH